MIRKILLVIFIFIFSIGKAFAYEDFNEYLKKVKNDVNKVWVSPSYSSKYTADVNFVIKKDGSIENIKIQERSKAEKLNKSALEAVNSVQKFDSLPAFYSSDKIELTLSFSNEVNRYIRKTSYTKKKKRVTKVKKIAVAPKSLKIKKVIYSEYFQCNSNFQDKMKDLVLNLEIQKAKKN